MTEAEILAKVKNGLGIQTEYQDETLKVYIEEVMNFLSDAGVHESVLKSSASVGCILQGVNDLWNYSAGGTKFSDYFKMRATQLALKGAVNNVQT